MRRRVLVVDDDEDILASVEVALTDAGWEVTTAANGREALALAITHPPDVIVIDLMMPIMHGWELAELLRHHPATGRVPLLVTSAGTDHEAVRADLVLRKPYSLDMLLAALDHLTARSTEAQPHAY